MSKRQGDPGYAAGWCIHYRYNRDVKEGAPDTCEAGVDYRQWHGMAKPCFLTDKGESKPDAPPCEHIRRPTMDEIVEHNKWANDRFAQTVVAMNAVAPFRKTHRGKRHMIDCPVCGTGNLPFSIAASNGHCHASCTTQGCVSW